MSARREFEMSEDDLKQLLAACKPVTAMFLSGGTPMFGTPQENANRAWCDLGKRIGRPYSGKFAPAASLSQEK
jgi:hypothetical protein